MRGVEILDTEVENTIDDPTEEIFKIIFIHYYISFSQQEAKQLAM